MNAFFLHCYTFVYILQNDFTFLQENECCFQSLTTDALRSIMSEIGVRISSKADPILI